MLSDDTGMAGEKKLYWTRASREILLEISQTNGRVRSGLPTDTEMETSRGTTQGLGLMIADVEKNEWSNQGLYPEKKMPQ